MKWNLELLELYGEMMRNDWLFSVKKFTNSDSHRSHFLLATWRIQIITWCTLMSQSNWKFQIVLSCLFKQWTVYTNISQCTFSTEWIVINEGNLQNFVVNKFCKKSKILEKWFTSLPNKKTSKLRKNHKQFNKPEVLKFVLQYFARNILAVFALIQNLQHYYSNLFSNC